jgi:predicted nuclease of predicted toxin-antitoxin system
MGEPHASDRVIMDWAVRAGYTVFTHDLDFGTMLALTHAAGPSVLQIRGDDVLPDSMEGTVIAALKQHDADLAAGALIVVDESRTRARILPI